MDAKAAAEDLRRSQKHQAFEEQAYGRETRATRSKRKR